MSRKSEKYYWLGEGVLSIAYGTPKIKKNEKIPADLLKKLNPKKLKDFLEKGLIGKNSPDEYIAKANKNAEKALAALKKELAKALKEKETAVKERDEFEKQLNEQLDTYNKAIEKNKELNKEVKKLKKEKADLITENLKFQNQLKKDV